MERLKKIREKFRSSIFAEYVPMFFVVLVLFLGAFYLAEKNPSTDKINKTIDKEDKAMFETSTIDLNGYTIEYTRTLATDDFNINSWSNVRILKGKKTVFDIEETRSHALSGFYVKGMGDNDTPMKDVTGDGVPELIILDFSGGFHCCSHYYVIELSDPLSILLDLDAGNQGIYFKDLNNDGVMEIETNEDVFSYWYTSFVGSPMPRVVLSLQGGKYKADATLMRKPAPTDTEVRKMADMIKGWGGWASPEVAWLYAIDLIYSGNITSAQKYVDLAWRKNDTGRFETKENFWYELNEQIQKSPYYDDLWQYFYSGDEIVWIGKIHGRMTYGRLLLENLESNAEYKYFIVEPDDVISNGALRYSPTTRYLESTDIIEVTGVISDICSWNWGVDDTEYRGCVPWIYTKKIEKI